MKKILLPTDFSENSLNAIRYAIQLFSDEECIFYLLNTYTPVLYDSDYILHSPASSLSLDELYKQNSEKRQHKVKDQIREEFPNALHHYKLISSFSLLNEEIKEQVTSKEIDLIVMGTQGATGAIQILFGTHTVHAIRRATCPLLAIPSGCKYTSPVNILFPTDYDINYTAGHLKLLKFLANAHGAVIHVFHILFGLPLGDKQENARKLLANYLDDVSHHFYTAHKNTVTEGI